MGGSLVDWLLTVPLLLLESVPTGRKMATQSGVNSFHVFSSTSSRAKHPDKGACEGASACRSVSLKEA